MSDTKNTLKISEDIVDLSDVCAACEKGSPRSAYEWCTNPYGLGVDTTEDKGVGACKSARILRLVELLLGRRIAEEYDSGACTDEVRMQIDEEIMTQAGIIHILRGGK